MNIVVLGAGTVGTSIADLLCRDNHSVTVVDSDPRQTKRINEELDVRAITGSASQSSVLFQAGMAGADVCLAVTGVDEINLVAASLSKAMGARRSIARVYAPVFRDLSTFDYQRHFSIDRMLSLEHLTALELARGIRDPNSVVLEQFARGALEAHEFNVMERGSAAGKAIRDLGMMSNVRIGTIKRGGRMWIAAANDRLEIDDQVTIFCRPENLDTISHMFHYQKSTTRRVIIAGGGETGLHLAQMLEREDYSVKLMESDEKRCAQLSHLLRKTVVVHCNATERGVLEEERVGTADVFVACTGDDENNIVACVEARDIGARQTMAVVGRPDYANIVGKLGIDLSVSERAVMAKQMMAYLNTGVIISRMKLPGGLINIVEVEVGENSPASQFTLAELPLPDRCLVVASIQQDFVRVPGADDTLKPHSIAVCLVEEDVIDATVKQFQAR